MVQALPLPDQHNHPLSPPLAGRHGGMAALLQVGRQKVVFAGMVREGVSQPSPGNEVRKCVSKCMHHNGGR